MSIYTMDGKALISYYLREIAMRQEIPTNTGIWCAIGKTNEFDSTTQNIPIELMDASNYDFNRDAIGIQGMKKCVESYCVIPDATGEIQFDATGYAIVTGYGTPYDAPGNDGIFSMDAHWIYFKFVLYYSELPIVPFRQIGIFYNPTHTAGTGAEVLQKTDITDPGKLIYYSNSSVRYRHTNQKDIIEVVIQT